MFLASSLDLLDVEDASGEIEYQFLCLLATRSALEAMKILPLSLAEVSESRTGLRGTVKSCNYGKLYRLWRAETST